MKRLALLAALIGSPAVANPVYDMCMRPGTYGAEQCDCAASAVNRSFSAGDRALYAALAAGYVKGRDDGLAMSDAWDAAVQSEARARGEGYPALAGQVAPLRQRWSEILERCGG